MKVPPKADSRQQIRVWSMLCGGVYRRRVSELGASPMRQIIGYRMPSQSDPSTAGLLTASCEICRFRILGGRLLADPAVLAEVAPEPRYDKCRKPRTVAWALLNSESIRCNMVSDRLKGIHYYCMTSSIIGHQACVLDRSSSWIRYVR